jgi:hypothetical protein
MLHWSKENTGFPLGDRVARVPRVDSTTCVQHGPQLKPYLLPGRMFFSLVFGVRSI